MLHLGPMTPIDIEILSKKICVTLDSDFLIRQKSKVTLRISKIATFMDFSLRHASLKKNQWCKDVPENIKLLPSADQEV